MNYGEVEALYAALHSIRPEKRTAFKARLKHFQRLGFPPGVNTGTGRPANYDAAATMLLGLALEWAQLGSSPESTVAMLTRWPDFIRAAVARALASRPPNGPDTDDVFLSISPMALEALMEVTEDGVGFGAGTASELAGTIEAFSRLALINLSLLIYRIAERLPDEATFRADLAAWAAGEGTNG